MSCNKTKRKMKLLQMQIKKMQKTNFFEVKVLMK